MKGWSLTTGERRATRMHLHVSDCRYGRVDVVPGECHVETEFVCAFWVPVLPRYSYLAGQQAGPVGREGIRLPLCWKSVLFAYIRVLCVATILAACMAMLSVDNRGRHWIIGPALTAAVSVAVFIVTYLFGRASAEREEELRQI